MLVSMQTIRRGKFCSAVLFSDARDSSQGRARHTPDARIAERRFTAIVGLLLGRRSLAIGILLVG